jgi:hypothetical protein
MPHKFINFWNNTAMRILLIIGKMRFMPGVCSREHDLQGSSIVKNNINGNKLEILPNFDYFVDG